MVEETTSGEGFLYLFIFNPPAELSLSFQLSRSLQTIDKSPPIYGNSGVYHLMSFTSPLKNAQIGQGLTTSWLTP